MTRRCRWKNAEGIIPSPRTMHILNNNTENREQSRGQRTIHTPNNNNWVFRRVRLFWLRKKMRNSARPLRDAEDQWATITILTNNAESREKCLPPTISRSRQRGDLNKSGLLDYKKNCGRVKGHDSMIWRTQLWDGSLMLSLNTFQNAPDSHVVSTCARLSIQC